jgi:hypothetical protein
MTGWIVSAAVITGGTILLLFVILIILRVRAYRKDPEDVETGEFTLTRYQPMERLLAEEDFLFLSAQPGYKPEIGAKLRRERRRIFRLYLRELAQDFLRLHAEARRMVADSKAEHADLVGVLLGQQLTFWRRLIAVELRFALGGLNVGSADVRGLLETLEAMRMSLARLEPARLAPEAL